MCFVSILFVCRLVGWCTFCTASFRAQMHILDGIDNIANCRGGYSAAFHNIRREYLVRNVIACGPWHCQFVSLPTYAWVVRMYFCLNVCAVCACVSVNWIYRSVCERYKTIQSIPYLHLADKNEPFNRVLHIQCNNFIGQLNPIERHQLVPNEAYSNNISMTWIVCECVRINCFTKQSCSECACIQSLCLSLPTLFHFYFRNCFSVVHTKETGTCAHTLNRLFDPLSLCVFCYWCDENEFYGDFIAKQKFVIASNQHRNNIVYNSNSIMAIHSADTQSFRVLGAFVCVCVSAIAQTNCNSIKWMCCACTNSILFQVM